MSQALFPINPGQKIMCKRKNLANNARSYASTLLPPTITLRSLQHTERQPSRERCFKGRVLSCFHFFFKIFLNDSIPTLNSKAFDDTALYEDLIGILLLLLLLLLLLHL